jgi:hypothetical protein
VEKVVCYLKATLLQELESFAQSFSQDAPGIATETYSYRHDDILHSLGVNCFPAGTNVLDERCVALIVNVIDFRRLTVKGNVQWAAPPFEIEGETALFENPNSEDLFTFCNQVRALLGTLRNAALRGHAPSR